MAKVPVEDLRYAAAYRIVSDDIRRNMTLQVAASRKEVEALRGQITSLKEESATLRGSTRTILDRNAQLEDQNISLRSKIDKQKPWTLIGKVTVGLCIVGIGWSLYQTTTAP